MNEIESMVYWVSMVYRLNVALYVLLLFLSFVFAFMLYLVTESDAAEWARAWCVRWLWAVGTLILVVLCLIVWVPSARDVALMARQRILESGGERVSPEVESYLRSHIDKKGE